MGLACIMPETYYTEGLNRHWRKKSRFEYYFPEFANMEPQAVLRQEISCPTTITINGHQNKTYWLEQVLGYVGRYDEYRVHNNSVTGSLRNDQTTDFSAWVIKHEVTKTPTVEGNVPILNTNLICSHKSITIPSSPACIYKHAQGDTDWSNYTTEYISSIDHNAWETGKSVNPFIAQFGISVEAVRPMPYVADPTKAKDWR